MSRWSKCPGSVRLSQNIPSTTSVYAEEGTKAHELAEKILKNEKVDFNVYDFEMIEAVQVYTRYVMDERKKATEWGVEEKFDLSELHPGLFGTCDAWIYHEDAKTLEVIDLKFGQGLPVEVENNVQLKYYSLGALLKLKKPVSTVKMTIAQPRCYHHDGPIRSTTLTANDLLEFASDLIDAALETEKEDAKLSAGDHCRFCPAAPLCPELNKQAVETAKNEFSPALSYSPEKLSETLSIIPAIEAWAKAVKEFAYREAQAGRIAPGYKLVPKRATRKWKEGENVEERLLKDFGLSFLDVTEQSLRSPAQIEKLIPKADREKLEELIVKESSGDTLVPDSDKRRESKPSIETEFTKIGE
jgi:hypothetical protein